MTLRESIPLRHEKYIAYFHVWSAFSLAMMAGDYFKILTLNIRIGNGFLLDNLLVGTVLALGGLVFLRRKLKAAEYALERLHRSRVP